MTEGAGMTIGKTDDIMRDEVNFSKFVGRMRKKFSGIFVDLLKTQLVLKGVVTPKEYDSMKEHITYDFIYDNHFAELREGEMLMQRMNVASMCEPYLGKYFSVYQVRHDILGFTDGEIKEQDRQIAYERNVGIIPDPNAQMNEEEEQPEEEIDMSQGQVPEDDMGLSGDPSEGLPPEMMQALGGGGGGKPSMGGGMPGMGGGASPF
tara:strand:- start:256 stop:873 length:618 start_codon:yes stop_codon:yes gene_type:complete